MGYLNKNINDVQRNVIPLLRLYNGMLFRWYICTTECYSVDIFVQRNNIPLYIEILIQRNNIPLYIKKASTGYVEAFLLMVFNQTL